MIQPPQPPYFEYHSEFDAKIYKRTVWPSLKGQSGQYIISGLGMTFMTWIIIAATLLVTTFVVPKDGWGPGIVMLTVIAFSIGLLMPYSILYSQVDQACKTLKGKKTTTWISDSHLLISSFTNVITAYPFAGLTLIHTDPDFYLLQAETQRVYVRRAGLQAAGLEEKFLALVNAPKT